MTHEAVTTNLKLQWSPQGVDEAICQDTYGSQRRSIQHAHSEVIRSGAAKAFWNQLIPLGAPDAGHGGLEGNVCLVLLLFFCASVLGVFCCCDKTPKTDLERKGFV